MALGLGREEQADFTWQEYGHERFLGGIVVVCLAGREAVHHLGAGEEGGRGEVRMHATML